MNYNIGNNTKIWSKAIDKDGYLNNKFGINENINKTQFPSYSFDLEWEPIKGAKTYGLLLQDFDMTKVFGFPFIQWTVLNITTNKLSENQSYNDWKKWINSHQERFQNDIIWQGYNSTVPKTLITNNKIQNNKIGGILPEVYTSNNLFESAMYCGPYPIENEHLYTLYLYGLDVDGLNTKFMCHQQNKMEIINKPYYVGDFMEAINNHVLDVLVLNFKYKKYQ